MLLETIELSRDDSGLRSSGKRLKYTKFIREPAYTAEGFLGERDWTF